jgi:prepilin-type N-terminal cleavage/methylation domain-containing protein
MKDSRGFTLIEMVVVLAVIAILAAMLTPIVTSYIDRARINSAASDVKKIAGAIVQFNTDTRVWPIYSSTTGFPSVLTTNVYDFMTSAGNAAVAATTGNTGADWNLAATNVGDLDAVVNQNRMALPTTGQTAWRGAYVAMGTDPWGTKYYFNSKFLVPGATSTHGAPGNSGTPSASAVYIISAGPNQTLDTNFDQATSAFTSTGDDIVARIR